MGKEYKKMEVATRVNGKTGKEVVKVFGNIKMDFMRENGRMIVLTEEVKNLYTKILKKTISHTYLMTQY